MNNNEMKFESTTLIPPKGTNDTVYHYAIYKEIRSWGFSLLGLGVIHLITSGFLSATWGIFIMVVGAASFYFRSASMMVIFATTLAWAAISNAVTGSAGWIIFAIIQVGMTVRVFMKYFKFRKGELNLENGQPEEVGLTPGRSAKAFPLLGFSFGLFSFVGFFVLMITVFVLSLSNPNYTASTLFGYFENALICFGVLGIAFGLASILSSYKQKTLSILGLVFGGLTVLIELGLVFVV